MSEFSSESRVSVLVEAQGLVRSLAEPRPAGDKVKEALRRACRKLPSWSPNRVRDIWNGDERIRVRAEELEELRVAARRVKEEKAAGHELAELRERLGRLERLLVSTDPDFHRETLTGLREQARGLSGADSTVDRTGTDDT